MKNLLLSSLVVLLSFTVGELSACSCAFTIEYFCESVSETEHIFLGEVTQKINGYGMTVDVIENVFNQIPDQSIDILGQDGVNCGEYLDDMSVGDTLLLAVNAEYWSTDWSPHLSQDFSWFLLGFGCGRRYLSYEDGQLNGPITPDVSTMSYSDFQDDLIPCLESSFFPQEAKFPEVGSAWKLRGLSDEVPQNPVGSETCESSECGNSYWEYAVNRKEIVADKVCSIVEVHFGEDNDQLEIIAEYAIHESAGKVFFYDEYSESFLLMLDFNLEVGDTLENYAPLFSDAYSIRYGSYIAEGAHRSIVTAIDSIEVNGQMLKQQSYGPLDDETLPSINHIVIEGIGNIGPFFGDTPVITEENVCQGSFLCFEQDDMEYSIFGDDCPCQFQEELTSVQDVSELSSVDVYPNPVDDVLNISLEDDTINNVELLDMSGRSRILTDNLATSHLTIETDKLESGLYMLMIHTSTGESYYDKVIVN